MSAILVFLNRLVNEYRRIPQEFLDDSIVPGWWQHTIFLPSVLLNSGQEEDD